MWFQCAVWRVNALCFANIEQRCLFLAESVNNLWPIDAMWCRITLSSVVQLVVCRVRRQVITWSYAVKRTFRNIYGTYISYNFNSLRPSDAYICASRLTIIGSDNDLSPGWRQAIIWTNAGILLIGPLGTNFGENLIEIYTFSFRQMHLKMSSGKLSPFCLGLNVLIQQNILENAVWKWWLFCSGPIYVNHTWISVVRFSHITIAGVHICYGISYYQRYIYP